MAFSLYGNMNLNYLAFFLISFVPLLIGAFWYHPNSIIRRKFGFDNNSSFQFGIGKLVLMFLLSFTLVYGYINLIIHQMGFYELFFTDIMKGSSEAEAIVSEFLSKYGDKHRHFGHGIFHGAINAFVFFLPFIGFITLIESRDKKYLLFHFTYCLITSVLIGGLISEFV